MSYVKNFSTMLHIFLTAVSLMLLPQSQALAQSSCVFHIASFNIHYIVPNDQDDDWGRRKHAVTSVLSDIDADIVAFQEVETFEGGHYNTRNLQLDWVNASITGYDNAATGDPKVYPSTQPIIYKPTKFRIVKQGFFFFSYTPEKIYSRQWDGRYPYFCSWVRFHNRCTGKDFYVFNVHNDFKSRGNRLKSSKLIADQIDAIVQDNLPIIVLGDFNATKSSKEIRFLEAIGLSVIQPTGATMRIWGMHILPAIDHILVSKDFQPQSDIKVWRNRYDGIYPSDHNPISVKLVLKDAKPGS